MKTFITYAVYESSDCGNAIPKLAARFATKDAAEKVAPSVGAFGGYVKPEELVIYDTPEEFKAQIVIKFKSTNALPPGVAAIHQLSAELPYGRNRGGY